MRILIRLMPEASHDSRYLLLVAVRILVPTRSRLKGEKKKNVHRSLRSVASYQPKADKNVMNDYLMSRDHPHYSLLSWLIFCLIRSRYLLSENTKTITVFGQLANNYRDFWQAKFPSDFGGEKVYV